MELIFVATDDVNLNDLLDEESLFRTYLNSDPNGELLLEAAEIDSADNLQKLLKFLFFTEDNIEAVVVKAEKQVFELTQYRNKCLTFEQLENRYIKWLEISGRENTMDEYGNLLGIVGYINRNRGKQNLFLITVNDQ